MMHEWLIAGLALVALAALAVALRERYERRALEERFSKDLLRFDGDLDRAVRFAGESRAEIRSDVDAARKTICELLLTTDDQKKELAGLQKRITALSQSCSTWYGENHAMHKKHETAFQEFLLSSGMTREVAPAIPEEQILVVKGAVAEHDIFRKLTAAEKDTAAKRWARTVTEKSLGGNQPTAKGVAA